MALQPNQQVRVAYDFQGEAANEELTVKEGDILKVLFTDVGEGWIQCESKYILFRFSIDSFIVSRRQWPVRFGT